MTLIHKAFFASAAFVAAIGPASGHQLIPRGNSAPAATISPLTYADLADLALPAALIAQVQIRRSTLLTPQEASGVQPGFRRFLVEAQALTLIRGPEGQLATLRYVVDVPADTRGRAEPPRRRSEWLVFANNVPNRPGEVRLVAPDAHLVNNPEITERVRALVREAVAPDAPPRITAIGRAFNVPGALPGTGETQIFLQSANNQPFSITINRASPGEPPRWFVSTSEFVDAGATNPQPNTLLWYRLACALPPRLPAQSLADSQGSADQVQADYQVVLDGLGRCPRTRRR